MRRSAFRQNDLVKTLKAAKAAGIEVARIEIDPDGKIVAVLGTGDGDNPSRNTADAILEKVQNARKKQAI